MDGFYQSKPTLIEDSKWWIFGFIRCGLYNHNEVFEWFHHNELTALDIK